MGYREYDGHPDGDYPFGTIVEIAAWMARNQIPGNAVIQYAGCGSHNIAFTWDEPEPPTSEFPDESAVTFEREGSYGTAESRW